MEQRPFPHKYAYFWIGKPACQHPTNSGVTPDEQENGKQDSASAGFASCQPVQGARITKGCRDGGSAEVTVGSSDICACLLTDRRHTFFWDQQLHGPVSSLCQSTCLSQTSSCMAQSVVCVNLRVCLRPAVAWPSQQSASLYVSVLDQQLHGPVSSVCHYTCLSWTSSYMAQSVVCVTIRVCLRPAVTWPSQQCVSLYVSVLGPELHGPVRSLCHRTCLSWASSYMAQSGVCVTVRVCLGPGVTWPSQEFVTVRVCALLRVRTH